MWQMHGQENVHYLLNVQLFTSTKAENTEGHINKNRYTKIKTEILTTVTRGKEHHTNLQCMP